MLVCDLGLVLSKRPFGRYYTDSSVSGEAIREELLAPIIKNSKVSGDKVTFIIDCLEGSGSGVLEEAFGGLIRYSHVTLDYFRKNVRLVSNDEYTLSSIDVYMLDANEQPRQTYISNLKSAYDLGIRESQSPKLDSTDYYERYLDCKKFHLTRKYRKSYSLKILSIDLTLDPNIEFKRIYSYRDGNKDKYILLLSNSSLITFETDNYQINEIFLHCTGKLVITVRGGERVAFNVRSFIYYERWEDMGIEFC